LNKTVKVKYERPDTQRLKITEKGDLIDLCIDSFILVNGLPVYGNPEEHEVLPGGVITVSLGVAMEIPNGYRANVYPRSSLFSKLGLTLTNSVGIIDNSYKGNEDYWLAVLKNDSRKYITLKRHMRVLQFEIVPVLTKEFSFEEVTVLETKDRGGYGSTGLY